VVDKQQLYHISITTVLVSVLLFLTVSLNSKISHYKAEYQSSSMAYQIPIKIQQNLTFGYNYTLSALRWFHIISKFGNLNEEEKNNATYVELAKNLDTITHLNPHAKHAYYMAATILPWAIHSTKLSRPLLQRAVSTMPKQWQWPFYMGFNAYWFDHDKKTAAHYLTQAASLKNAPPIVMKLALRMRADTGEFDTALMFLDRQIKNTSNQAMQKQLIEHQIAILTEKTLYHLERRLHQRYPNENQQQALQKLLKQGYAIPQILPDGGHILFKTDGTLISSKSKRRFKLFIPAKRQGVVQHESTH